MNVWWHILCLLCFCVMESGCVTVTYGNKGINNRTSQDVAYGHEHINDKAYKEASALYERSYKLKEAGKPLEAIPIAEQAYNIFNKHGGPDHANTADTLNLLGTLYEQIGVLDKANKYHKRALEIREKIEGPEAEDTAESLGNLANIYQRIDWHRKAIPLLERALKINEKIYGTGNIKTAGNLNNLSTSYKEMGFYDKALSYLEKTLAIREKFHGIDHPEITSTLNNIGVLYLEWGAFEKALVIFERALKINKEKRGPEHPKTAQIILNLGSVYQYIGDGDRALLAFMQALRIFEKVVGSDARETDVCIQKIGMIYIQKKDFVKAEAYLKRSKGEDALVDLYLATGKNLEALQIIKKQTIPSQGVTTGIQIGFDTREGIALSALGQRIRAEELLLRAIKGTEDFRSKIKGDKGGFGSLYLRPYNTMVSTLVESARFNEKLPANFQSYGDTPASAGFYFAEATKARVLLEMIVQSHVTTTQADVPTELKRKEQDLLDQFKALDVNFEIDLKTGKESYDKATERKDALRKEFDKLIAELYEKYPLYAALHYPRPLPAKNLPLKDQEVLLEYAIGDKASSVFVVRRGGDVKVVSIPIGKEALEMKVKTFMAPFLDKQGTGYSIAAAKELYDLLLAGALAGVKQSDELIIVPDGILGLLPFEVLVEKSGKGEKDSSYVGDRFLIRYYQSATVMALQRTLKQEQAVKPFFALGNPVFSTEDSRYTAFRSGQKTTTLASKNTGAAYRGLANHKDWGRTTRNDQSANDLVYIPLPETEDEVRSIAKLFGVQPSPPDILLNLDASANRLNNVSLKDYRYIHFATHADLPGHVQGVNEPFILLGQVDNAKEEDGFLTMSKVLGLNLNADMVVLSACLTGRGKVMEGEGVANFARAFQHAGAKSVLVSLWEVSSNETLEYMEKFYGYLKAGKSRSEALRLARNEIKSRYPNPFIWAPFILHGEG